MQFTLKQLSYFVAAGESGSILRASENIHVSQPSISNAITHLEDVFQIQLFVRHHAQGMSLTTAGLQMMDRAKQILRDADEMKSLAGILSDQIYGTINVGCFIPLAPIVTPELCHGFLQVHGDVDVHVTEDDQAGLLSSLKKGSIDVALTYNLQLDSEVDFTPLVELEPYLLLPEKHPLSKQPDASLHDLSDEGFILLDLPLSNNYFMSIFSALDINPSIYARTRHIEVQRSLVARGYGYSLANVRPLNQKSLDGSGLAYAPLQGDQPGLVLGVAMLANLKKTVVVESFVEYCKQQISKNNIPGMANL
ncbi:MAG: LysR family transcriptional regulator [Pseudomonadota bacterium]